MTSPIASDHATASLRPRDGAVAAAFAFILGYPAALVLVCMFNAARIIHDAVVGPLFVAGYFGMLLAPSAIAAVAAVTFRWIPRLRRLRLAVLFSVLVAIVVELLFVRPVAELLTHYDTALGVAVINAALALTFLILGRYAVDGTKRSPS